MVTIVTLPSTVDGIKRLAKAIKRELDIPYMDALEEAAHKAGFQNFLHAKRAIEASTTKHSAFLTVYWKDRDAMPWRGGRETIEVVLSRPLADLITRHQVSYCRNLKGFKMESVDHLEMVQDITNQSRAVELLMRASITLQFLDATRLRPAHTQAQYKAMRIATHIPGKDHESWWIDPQSNEWLVLDEPYQRARKERMPWLLEHGLKSTNTSWPGLYYPGSCVPSMISPSMELLERVRSQVEAIPSGAPATGEVKSERYFSQFSSPARAASGKARRSRIQPSYGERNGALPYGGAAGVKSLWRPARPMSLELHTTVGPILHKLCNSGQRAAGITGRVYDRLNTVRSLLEDWAYMEHQDRITREVEDKLYYGPGVDGYTSPQQALQAIEDVCKGLLSGYEECKPRRELLEKLEAAEKGVQIWQGKQQAKAG